MRLMWRRSSRASVFASLLVLTACCWTERVGDFNYICRSAFHPLDGPSCEHRLTHDYLLRYGEGSGDHVVLALEIRNLGSAALINLGDDVVRRIGLNENILIVQSSSDAIYVAPARRGPGFNVEGPFTEEEFAARYPNAPEWREVQ